jgi:hypothetical protein
MLITLTLQGHHRLEKGAKRRYDVYVRQFIKKFKLRGIKVIEIKPKGRGLYFYHYHLLVDSFYIPQKKLSDAWLEISGSYVVDVRRISVLVGLNYLVKRSASPMVVKIEGQSDLSGSVTPDIEAVVSRYLTHVYKSRFYSVFGFKNLVIDEDAFICPFCHTRRTHVDIEDISDARFEAVVTSLPSVSPLYNLR